MPSVKNTRGVYKGPYITIYYLVNQKTYSEPHQHKKIVMMIINDNNDNGSNTINDDNNDDNHISLIS